MSKNYYVDWNRTLWRARARSGKHLEQQLGEAARAFAWHRVFVAVRSNWEDHGSLCFVQYPTWNIIDSELWDG